MKNFKNKVAVITGAGSGIGRALALQFTERGAKVALNDWNQDSVEETLAMVKAKGGTGMARPFDVSDKKSVYDFADEVMGHFGQVDIVINNAGMGIVQKGIEFTDYEDFEKIIGVNMWGVIYGSKAFLPHLRKRPEAAILNTSSVLGLFAHPANGAYATSKFAVRGFTETLRHEMEAQGLNIHVCCIHPGAIKTGIVNNVNRSKAPLSEEDLKKEKAEFDKFAKTTSASAAAAIIKAIEQKSPKLLIGNDAKMVDKIVRLFPTKYGKFLIDGNMMRADAFE